ncbi:hypothetical protein EW146_g1923 [Bondarzewia mesenterica]|uniref:SET domain-containing protein n=1 Tax=Bondarzewia mesenterica TaxID=1095465 RepID=A0A4S4M2B7_9AGAM|nr:hypothetical protein EW146_g1923 [Bondarzewia mesenterica]
MDIQLGSISRLSFTDQRLFVSYGVGEPHAPAFHCVHHAFEYCARTQPDAVAIEHLGDGITYSTLDRCANRLASRLRNMGVVPGSRVCLLAQRSIAMVIGILAILKAGGAYVPLDGGIVTQSTLEYVIQDSGCMIALTLDEYRHRVQGIPILSLDDSVVRQNEDYLQCLKPEDLSSPSDSVYVIYTSGTTGKPKGVDVMHSNVTNLVCLSPGNIEMSPGRRVSQLMNIAFDMAAWVSVCLLVFPSVIPTVYIRHSGNSWLHVQWVHVMHKRQNIEGMAYLDEDGRYRYRHSVNDGDLMPYSSVPHDPIDYPNIRVVATAGEVCPQALADAWAKNGHFYNSCGPTEITIVNTVQPHAYSTPLSIGKPTPNNNVYILDENLQPVPMGESGVMWAGGKGVTRGYINLPEKTAERYKLDPFINDGSYMFNTGDLGRWRSDGTLEHLGRVDDQVKVKGFRVELDGVAAAMETCPEVKVAAALLIEAELWGFITPENVDVSAVISAASKVQPYYAVPTRFLVLPEFPYTGNGKTDKRALRHLALDNVASENAIIFDEKENVPPVALPTMRKDSPIVRGDTRRTDAEKTITALSPIYQGHLRSSNICLEDSGDTVSTNPSKSSSTDVSPSVVEKGNGWEGYLDDDLPDKSQGKLVRNLRHQILSLYRRLFSVVFITNMAIFIATLVRGGANAQHLGLIVVANLFCAILMRQDYVINAFFNVFCAVPSSWPMAIRRVCARVYSIGGLHSGCAISGVVWLILFTAQATREFLNDGPTSVATVVISYWILLLLLVIVSLAYPKFRVMHHDRYEATHRFLGWTATVLVWCQVVLLANDYRPSDQALGIALVKAPPFWLVLIMSISIILPWARLRKVPVRAEVLSGHAVRLYFDYVTPIAGSFTRISDNPFMEWHGFATIPVPNEKGYSLVVSKAGDWTSRQIAKPPSELWVRGAPTFGVLRIVPLFRRVILIATGSGIGPCAPCIFEQRVPMRLLWTSPNVRQTFGDKFVDSILEASPDAVIYDTRAHGKPDMVKLTYRLVREFKAEAVCIISNQKLTRKVVYGMMSRGIPAFDHETTVNALISVASSNPNSPLVRLGFDSKARNRAVAVSDITKGKLILSTSSLSTALLASEKGQRCSGCASYWYCGPDCQKYAWTRHHKLVCKAYPQFIASPAYERLESHQRTDAILFSHLIAEFVASKRPSLNEADSSSTPFNSVFRHLLPQESTSIAVPPLCLPSASSFASLGTLYDLYSRFGNNNFVIHSHLTTIAHGIYPLASRLFNHSCVPNAATRYHFVSGRPVRMDVVALRPIRQDEEITIPYLDPALPFSDRQHSLKINYGFTCICPLCRFGRHLDDSSSSPSEDDLLKVEGVLHEFTGCLYTRPAPLLNSLRNYEDISPSLFPFFHSSVLPRMSDTFSRASHEGDFRVALEVGHTLLAVYLLVYPPNYPQIGIHALEMAKTAWNAGMTDGYTFEGPPGTSIISRAQWYLTVARDILETYGLEGDEGGPLEESRLLRNLIAEQLEEEQDS